MPPIDTNTLLKLALNIADAVLSIDEQRLVPELRDKITQLKLAISQMPTKPDGSAFTMADLQSFANAHFATTASLRERHGN